MLYFPARGASVISLPRLCDFIPGRLITMLLTAGDRPTNSSIKKWAPHWSYFSISAEAGPSLNGEKSLKTDPSHAGESLHIKKYIARELRNERSDLRGTVFC